MELSDFYNKYPTQKDCIKHLEKIVWGDNAVCPYCNSKYNTILKNEERRHCNTCNTSFSVTVNTLFHKTKIDLQKWFYAIYLLANNIKMSVRSLGKELHVTKDTALKITRALNNELSSNPEFINAILAGSKNIIKT